MRWWVLIVVAAAIAVPIMIMLVSYGWWFNHAVERGTVFDSAAFAVSILQVTVTLVILVVGVFGFYGFSSLRAHIDDAAKRRADEAVQTAFERLRKAQTTGLPPEPSPSDEEAAGQTSTRETPEERRSS